MLVFTGGGEVHSIQVNNEDTEGFADIECYAPNHQVIVGDIKRCAENMRLQANISCQIEFNAEEAAQALRMFSEVLAQAEVVADPRKKPYWARDWRSKKGGRHGR